MNLYPLRKIAGGTERYGTISIVFSKYFIHVNKLFVHVQSSNILIYRGEGLDLIKQFCRRHTFQENGKEY